MTTFLRRGAALVFALSSVALIATPSGAQESPAEAQAPAPNALTNLGGDIVVAPPGVDAPTYKAEIAEKLGTSSYESVTLRYDSDTKTWTPIWTSSAGGLTTADGAPVTVSPTAKAFGRGAAKSTLSALSGFCSLAVANPYVTLDAFGNPIAITGSTLATCTGDVSDVDAYDKLYKRENLVYILKASGQDVNNATQATAAAQKFCQSGTVRYWKNSGMGSAYIEGNYSPTPWYDTTPAQFGCSDNS